MALARVWGGGLRFLNFACEQPTMSASCIYRFFSSQPLDTCCIPMFARPVPSSLLFPLICVCLCSKVILISYCNGSGRFGISLFPKLVLVCFFFLNYFLTVLQSMWDLCSLMGTEPAPSALKRWTLNHWNTRQVPVLVIFGSFSFSANFTTRISSVNSPARVSVGSCLKSVFCGELLSLRY